MLFRSATGFYLEYGETDIETLRECIKEGYKKYESMRLRFVMDEDGTLMQYLVPTEDREIPVVDFTAWREEDAHDEMRKWSKEPFEFDGGPMNEIAIVRLPNNYEGLYMKVHHMTMDSSSIIGFYSYVLQLYCSKKFEGVDAPKDPKSYLDQLKLDLKYEANSKARQKDEEYWMKELEAPEPIYTPFSFRNRLEELRKEMKDPNIRDCPSNGRNITADIKVYDLEDQPSRELIAFCEKHHVPVAVLLLTGLRTVFSKFAGGETDVSVKNAIARRGTVLESQSGGSRIHFWPLRTIIEPETTFLDALKIVHAKENALLRHANYDPVAYMGATREHYGAKYGAYECLTLTYQPLSAAALKGRNIPDIKFKSMLYTNGVALQHVYVTVMHRPTDDGLSFHMEYQKEEVSEHEIETLYYYLCRTLFYGIEDPNRTIGEIIDWI